MGLVEVAVEGGDIITERHAPIDKPAPLTRLVLRTPFGRISVERYRDQIFSAGPLVPTAVLELAGQPSIASVRKGMSGQVGHARVRIVRDRFGLRRTHRNIDVTADGITWTIVYARSRHYQIRWTGSGEVVYEQRGRKRLLDSASDPAEASLALAIVESGIVETSSLLNFVTTP